MRGLAHAELSDNHDCVLALHTDTSRPHVHLTVPTEGLNRIRFNPRPVQLNRFRERFARELRARGVAAEATPRRARGQGVAGSSMALVELRARLSSGSSRVMTDADRRTNKQSVAIAWGQVELPAFVGRGTTRWQLTARRQRHWIRPGNRKIRRWRVTSKPSSTNTLASKPLRRCSPRGMPGIWT